MFLIEEQNFGEIFQYHLRNVTTGEYVSILPEFGGTINQVALSKNNTVYELLDGCSDYTQLLSEGRGKFKGSKLFPFPNRIADGQYIFEGNTYNFPINFPNEKNAIHGIVTESNFKIIEQSVSTKQASITIAYATSGEEEGYPFKTSLTIIYSLSEEGFSCKTIVENKDTKNIPVGDGWHPYIKTGSKMDHCYLSLPTERSFEVDGRMIPTGVSAKEVLFSNIAKIGSKQIDTGYKLAVSEQPIVSTVVIDPLLDLSITVWQEGGAGKYNYLQIYIPPDRKSIAIEPMTCLTDAFNNKEGLLVVSPNEKRNFSFGLKLE